jgi:hypothetical protein
VKPLESFSIRFVGDQEEFSHGERTRRGEIRIGVFRELFNVPVDYWKANDYREQWSSAKATLRIGQAPVVFATAIRSRMQLNSFIAFWVVYRCGDIACIQNKAFLCSRVPIDFKEDQQHFVDLCGQRSSQSGEGYSVSEWQLPWASIELAVRE